MKKWTILGVVIVITLSILLFNNPGKSNLKTYYSGDAVVYQNNIFIATTNTGSLEIFKLEGSVLNLVDKIRPFDARFNKYDDFFDTKLSVENGRLFVYAVSHYTLYKYEVLSNKLDLVKKSSNTYWEWYNQVDKLGNDLATVSAKGIKIFNNDLEVINSYDFTNPNSPYNLNAHSDRFVLSVNEKPAALQVYDRETRSLLSDIPLNFKYEKGNRRAYQDAAGYLYVVDDYYAKKFDVSGQLLGHFEHIGHQGFDIDASGHNNYLYFSNGVGVVKLDKEMNLIASQFTGSLGGYAGWAMGLKALYLNGDKLVVFNNSNILVLDEDLRKVASIEAIEVQTAVYPTENLFLNLDKGRAAVGSQVMVSGGGFWPEESLNINFGRQVSLVETDHRGRFSKVIDVPELKSGGHDIKVIGDSSELHYSISFQVE